MTSDLDPAAASTSQTQTQTSTEPDRDALLAATADAEEFFRRRLAASWVPDYLTSRGLAPALDSYWAVGHAPQSWTALTDHLRDAGYNDATLAQAGLTITSRDGRTLDRFRDRLTLAIRDLEGDVVGFVARAAPGEAHGPKYLNTPTTALYRKGTHLFGAHESRTAIRDGALPVLVEGPLDAIAIHVATKGRHAGLALCGTAMTVDQAAVIASTVPSAGSRVVVALDSDDAGTKAARRCYEHLRAVGLDPRAADLPPGIDPADVLRAQGRRQLSAMLTSRATPLVDVLVEHELVRSPESLRWVEGQVAAARRAAALVAPLPSQHRDRLARRITEVTGLEPRTVRREIRAAALVWARAVARAATAVVPARQAALRPSVHRR